MSLHPCPPMIHFARAVLPVAALLLSMPAMADSPDGGNGKPMWEKSGDMLQWGIPLVGLGLSFLLDGDGGWGFGESGFSAGAAHFDLGGGGGFGWPGPQLGGSQRRDFLISFARMEVATYGLKYAIDADRPNGGGQSFPSGHTAAAFMGAEFIRKEYGWWWGAPAYAAASWVGYTRVESNNHYWRDVLGGAALGVLSNHDYGSGLTHGELAGGRWAVEPSLFVPGNALSMREVDDKHRPGLESTDMAPGLRVNWRF